MHIIAIAGFIGSGKDAVANHIIKKYNYIHVDFGDIVRDYATKTGRTHSREDLQATRRYFDKNEGKEFFALDIVKKIKKNKWNKVVVTGLRNPEDAEPMKRELGHNLIMLSVDADERIRFERLKKRNSPRDPKSFDEFKIQEKNEAKLFDIKGVVSMADHNIDNNGSYGKLKINVDKFMRGRKLT